MNLKHQAGKRRVAMVHTPILLFFWFTVFIMNRALAGADNITLCYHMFNHALDTNLYSVLPEVFQWQIHYIKQNNIKFARIDDIISAYDSPNAYPGDSVLITVDDGWKDFMDIVPFIQKEIIPVTLFLYPSVIGGTPEFFTLEDLGALKEAGCIDFGCHSYSHPLLTGETDSALQRQIVESKELLESLLGRSIASFAYPYGIFDERSRELAREHYSVAFGVKHGVNTKKTDRYNLNRFVIDRSTTFGEFTGFIDFLTHGGREAGYSVEMVDNENGKTQNAATMKIKMYKYPPGERSRKALIIPDSHMGGGWAYKIIDKLTAVGVQTFVLVSRNNYIPFYHPSKAMSILSTGGLKEYLIDIAHVIQTLSNEGGKIVIITWGDGFDLTLAYLASRVRADESIKGLVALNPSIGSTNGTKVSFRERADYYNTLLKKEEHDPTLISPYLKLKTISDLMAINPTGPSPFAKKLGFNCMTNEELFFELAEGIEESDFSVDFKREDLKVEDFLEAFKMPIPLFNMITPYTLLRDVCILWYKDFRDEKTGILHKDSVNLPAAFFVSAGYKANLSRIKATFPGLVPVDASSADKKSPNPLSGNKQPAIERLVGELSTVEVMLSDSLSNAITEEVDRIFKGKTDFRGSPSP